MSLTTLLSHWRSWEMSEFINLNDPTISLRFPAFLASMRKPLKYRLVPEYPIDNVTVNMKNRLYCTFLSEQDLKNVNILTSVPRQHSYLWFHLQGWIGICLLWWWMVDLWGSDHSHDRVSCPHKPLQHFHYCSKWLSLNIMEGAAIQSSSLWEPEING